MFGTASSKDFKALEAEPYGSDGLVDYADEEWPERIRSLTNGIGVDYAYDCISEGWIVAKVGSTLRSSDKMAIVRSKEGGAWTAQNFPVEPWYGAVWEGLGEEVQC